MTYGDILTRVEYQVLGEAAARDAFTAALRGANGLIAQARKQILRSLDWWFMREADLITLDGTTWRYDLTTITGLKNLSGVRNYDATSGATLWPLARLSNSQAGEVTFGQGSTPYPTHYRIINDTLELYPIPTAGTVLLIDYYAYPAALSDVTATFDAYEDDLSTVAPEAIIHLASSLAAGLRADADREQRYYSRYQEALASLKREHCVRHNEGITDVAPREL